MTFEKIEFNYAPGGEKILDGSNVFIMGRDRVVNGTIKIFEDMDDEHFKISISFYSDTSGNGNFKPLPYNVSEISPCAARDEYGSYAMPSLDPGVNTNFPIDGDICPIPKGTYYFNDIDIQTDNLPSTLPRGFIKGIGTLYKDGERVGDMEILARVEDKYI